MSDKVDNNHNAPKDKRISPRERRNIKVRSKETSKSDNNKTILSPKISEQTNVKNAPPNANDISNQDTIDNEEIIVAENNLSKENNTIIKKENTLSKENTTIITKESETSKQDNSTKTKKATRESLRDRQLANRSKRRERHQKRKQELLQSALSKLKSNGQNDKDTLNALEKSLASNMSSQDTESSITSSVSEKEILENATPQEAVKSESPKAQSAKDRFKNALKKITTSLNEESKTENANQSTTESPQELAFKKKLHERNKVKKMVTEYLENMGLSYAQGNFQILCNTMTDTLLLNLEAILPKTKKRIEELQKRAECPVRSGNNILSLKTKKTKPSEIVGDLFSRFDIDSKKDKIILKSNPHTENICLPQDDFDTLLEDLINHTLMDMSDIKNIETPKIPKNINIIEFQKNNEPQNTFNNIATDTAPVTLNHQTQSSQPITKDSSAPLITSQKPQRILKQVLGNVTHTQNKLNEISNLKSRLNKLN